jgi:hypothetical protein
MVLQFTGYKYLQATFKIQRWSTGFYRYLIVKINEETVGFGWLLYLAAGMACLFIRQGLGGKVKGGSPCNGISELDIAKGGVASNYQN